MKAPLALLALAASASAGFCAQDSDCERDHECSIPKPASTCAAAIAEGKSCTPQGGGQEQCCETGTTCRGSRENPGSIWWRTCQKAQGSCVRKSIKKRYECTDKTLRNGKEWHDGRWGKFTCQKYADWDACESKGHKHARDGLTANDACCACGGGVKGKRICPPRVRKAWSSLECHERKHYVDAVNAFKTNEPEEYELLVTSHVFQFPYAHGTSAFLHWHRWYLIGYENALRAQPGFECVTLPYWDWETDSGNEFHARVYRADTFGSWDGLDPVTGCVTNGAFSHWETSPSAQNEQMGTTCLRRAFQDPPPPFTPLGPLRAFATLEELAGTILALPPPAENATEPGPRTFDVFRGPLEGRPHAWPHIITGGWGPGFLGGPDVTAHMTTGSSPDDPLFWVHHCNVDRIFAIYQDYHGHDFVKKEDAKEPEHYERVVDDACVPGCVNPPPGSLPCDAPPVAEACSTGGECPPWCAAGVVVCEAGCSTLDVNGLAFDGVMPFGDADGNTVRVLQGRVTVRDMHSVTDQPYPYTYGPDNLAAALDANPDWTTRNAWTFVEPRDPADVWVPVDECGPMPPARPGMDDPAVQSSQALGCLPGRGAVTFATCHGLFEVPEGFEIPQPAGPPAGGPPQGAAGARGAKGLATPPKGGYRDSLCAALAAGGCSEDDVCTEDAPEAAEVFEALSVHMRKGKKGAHWFRPCEIYKTLCAGAVKCA